MDKAHKCRRKKKYICPNPLFEKWLTEWKQEAAEKGLKIQYTYAKALSSLRKYPLPLSSGKEAKILEYFGDKICSMLDAKLLEWKQNNSSGCSRSSQSSTESDKSVTQTVNNPSPVSHKQTTRSPKAAKSSINVKVVNMGRVTVPVKPVMMNIDLEEESSCDMEISDKSFFLFPGSFSIILCVDNCETYSGQGRNKKLFLPELQKAGMSFDVRKLHVGDFLWIARENIGEHRELVLDYIIERKRMDDLAHSIKDGRFREQKFRMKNCGLKNPIYLVEDCKKSCYLGLPEATLEQAIVNTQVIDGFIIKRTPSVKESAAYLSVMTKLIKSKFENQTLTCTSKEVLQKKKFPSNTFMTFKEFNCSSMKNKSLSVKEMFAKHLLQFHGLSVDRAAAIVDHFETPSRFLEAYHSCSSEEEKIQMVASIKFGINKKNIGPALSRSLYQYYCVGSPPK